jgi:hypothetical protein
MFIDEALDRLAYQLYGNEWRYCPQLKSLPLYRGKAETLLGTTRFVMNGTENVGLSRRADKKLAKKIGLTSEKLGGCPNGSWTAARCPLPGELSATGTRFHSIK